jgi:hypothetical protein
MPNGKRFKDRKGASCMAREAELLDREDIWRLLAQTEAMRGRFFFPQRGSRVKLAKRMRDVRHFSARPWADIPEFMPRLKAKEEEGARSAVTLRSFDLDRVPYK